MQIYQGKSVFSGIAIGKIRVYKKNERQVKRVKVENPDAEMARFEEAKSKGIAQLGVLYEKACKEDQSRTVFSESSRIDATLV